MQLEEAFRTRVLSDLRTEGVDVRPEVLAGLSPYRTDHINHFGDYVRTLSRQVAPIDFTRHIHALEPTLTVGNTYFNDLSLLGHRVGG